MPSKKKGTQKDRPQMSDHATRALELVREWPEWKKAFANDIYSASAASTEMLIMQKKQHPDRH